MQLSRTAPAARPSARPPAALLGRVMVVAGLLLLIAFFGDIAAGLWQQQRLNQAFRAQVPIGSAVVPTGEGPRIQPYPVDGVDFAISVPRIDYFSAVAEGTDQHTLAAGPGHYSGMSWPGQGGNVGVAAHNVYWVRFNDLQNGDRVRLETRWGTYTYQVTGKRIVSPDDRGILVPTPTPRLTLTTCWPLWAGAFATQRLVIVAEQVDPPAAVT